MRRALAFARQPRCDENTTLPVQDRNFASCQVTHPLDSTRDSAPTPPYHIEFCERFLNSGNQDLVRGGSQLAHFALCREITVDADRRQRQHEHYGETEDEPKLQAEEPPSHC